MFAPSARLGFRIAGCRLPRALLSRMADPALLIKRQRISATASVDAAAAAQQTEAAAPGLQQQQQQQPAASSGGGAKKPKQIVMPTPVPPPMIPTDHAAWENAVLLVDKPQGWTSFDVCGKLRGALAAVLRKRSKEVKVGHAGTLDPMATGLLIVCVGRGTKAVDAFMAMTKQYSGTLRLGEATPSYDAESEVDERAPWEHITDEEMLAAREGLMGEIQQLPPMYSAVKVGGQRLYNAARKGQDVERQPRTITVERFDLWRDEADAQNVHFRIVCSKGTYIRSLAADLGRALGSAAHLTGLRREAIGGYSVEGAWEVQQLAAQLTEQRQAQQEQRRQSEGEVEGKSAAEVRAAAAAATTQPGTA